MASTRNVVLFLRILLCITDEQITIDILNPKRSKTGGYFRIGEAPNRCHRYIMSIRAPSGRRAEHIDRSAAKVRRKKKHTLCVGPKDKALVDSARRVVDREDGLVSGSQSPGPSRNGPVLGIKNEAGRQISPRDEERRRGARSRVPHEAGGRGGR